MDWLVILLVVLAIWFFLSIVWLIYVASHRTRPEKWYDAGIAFPLFVLISLWDAGWVIRNRLKRRKPQRPPPRPTRSVPKDTMNPWQRAIDEAFIVNCVDCTHEGEPPEQALARLVRVEIQMAELHKPRQDLVPGVMHCAKCKFQLTRTTLCVADGNAYAGNNDTEPCPNGCGPLWPVTWEQEARSCWKGLERMHDRVVAAERAVAELEAKRATVLEFPKS